MEVKGNITGVPGGLYGPGNLTSTDTGLHPHRARITAKATGTNRYAHEQVNEGDFPAFAGTLAASFGVVGTSDVSGYPAYELAGRTDVPVGAVVTLTPAGDLTYLTFTYDGPGDGSSADAGTCGGGCGTFLGVLDTWCFKLSVVCNTGEFDHATFAQDQDGVPLSEARMRQTASGTWTLQYWNPDKVPSADWDNWLFDWSGGSGIVTLTFDTTAGPYDGTPVLTIDGKTLLTRCVGSDATFSGGRRNGFTGAAATPTVVCDPNDFTLRVECTCCDIDQFQGAGWYCIEDTGPTDCFAAELLDEDRCDTSIVICSGPYADQAAAEAVCPPGISTTCCPDDTIPQTLTVVMTGGTCPGTYTATYGALLGPLGTGAWEANACTVPTVPVQLYCDSGTWKWSDTGVAADTVDCAAPSWTFTVTGGTLGTYTVSVTL